MSEYENLTISFKCLKQSKWNKKYFFLKGITRSLKRLGFFGSILDFLTIAILIYLLFCIK